MEIWKNIIGYEGFYEVNNKGQIRSVDHDVIDSKGIKRHRTGRLIKPYTTNGYCIVDLCKCGIRHKKEIHRIVAEAFIPNPNNLPQVNHKNEIKSDNRVENLEWCTPKYNMNYGTIKKRSAETNIKTGKWNPNRIGLPKKIAQKLWYEENRIRILSKLKQR